MKSEPKNWYALYTRPKMEKKVADLLTRKKVEVYLPLNKAKSQWADRKKISFEPLFTSLVFVSVKEDDLDRLRLVEGVINILHWRSLPAIIQQEEIDTIQGFLKEYDNIRLEKALVNTSAKVRIVNGPLMMWEGNLVEIKTNSTKVVLPSLGYALVAEIVKNNSEVSVPMQELALKAV